MVSSNGLSESALFRALRSRAVDPLASIGACAFTIACIFEVPERLQMTASDLGIAIGSLCTLAASARMLALRSRR